MCLEKKIDLSIQNAYNHQSKLTPEIHNRPSMSSEKVRHLLNNLGGCFSKTVYLEVGTWQGVSLISALYDNDVEAYVVDDWSYGKAGWCEGDKTFIKNAFQKNVQDFTPNAKIKLIEESSLKVNLDNFENKVNYLFYDADHTYKGQYRSLMHLYPILANTFICVIDDWSSEEMPGVQRAAYDAFHDSNCCIVKKWELPHNGNADPELWWNGLFVGIVRKTQVLIL